MRDIQFRGKRKDNKEWVYWNEYGECSESYVCQFGIFIHISKHDIIPETVGQFTGFPDKNGKKIFEDDIAKTFNGEISEVRYGEFRSDCIKDAQEDYYLDADGDERSDVGFHVAYKNGDCNELDNMAYKWIEVIGNAHDNPEMMTED